MAFIHGKTSILALICSASLLVVGVADAAEPTKSAKPQLSGLKATVAQGGKVDLAASTMATTELARLRPNFEELKPRLRTNAE